MISNTYANKILTTLCGVTDQMSIPSKLYLGLCSDAPNASTGVVSTEPTVPSYARVIVGGSDNNVEKYFGDASGGVITNSKEIQFKTAREDWGTMNYFLLSDTATGAAIMWGEITDGVTIGRDTVPVFYEGDLKISLDVALS